MLNWLWESGNFLSWVSDNPENAHDRVEEYWTHCEELDFFHRLGLPKSQYRYCVPFLFHADGVKIYKSQKAWVYSYASACRKGTSIETKLVLLILREATIIKDRSHDRVGETIGYIMRTLMTGTYPSVDHRGEPFLVGSAEYARAGNLFAGGWSMAFSGFKSDWEARHIIHKSNRFYNSRWVCEHCLASRDPDLTFGDFRMTANCLSHRFSHQDYLIMNASRLSSWVSVPGWTKDRNLEGIACVLVAALVCDSLERSIPDLTLKSMDQLLASDVYVHYKSWCRSKGHHATSCSFRFSTGRFGKETWATCPELGSVYKAAVVKSMIFWCAAYLREHQTAPNGRLRYLCMQQFATFQYLLDSNGPFFSRDMSLRNPRFEHCYQDEDLMMEISRISSRTHPSTMELVTMRRYRALLQFFIHPA
ncbi:unnamed protein product [Durusdinium trenchii]|uniref:Uncharacterized protein n=1 Tax=Durusdinium trenchii TaxID=1381693 RepID=A0ABP0SI48_9DINO